MGYANLRVAQDSYHCFRAKLRGDLNCGSLSGRNREKYRAKVMTLGDGEPPRNYEEPVDDEEERVGEWGKKREDDKEQEKGKEMVVKEELEQEMWVWDGEDVTHEYYG